MNRAALTFDDGPSEWTDPILDTLQSYGAHGTFFILGSHAEGNLPLLWRTIGEGHEVGVHGWDHRPCDKLTPDEIYEQLARTYGQIQAAGAASVRWWRPPWHLVTPQAAAAAETVGLSYCGVTIDGYDVNRTWRRIVDDIERDIQDGSIIGLHDGVAANGNMDMPHRKNTVQTVAQLLHRFRKSYEFVTVSELLA